MDVCVCCALGHTNENCIHLQHAIAHSFSHIHPNSLLCVRVFFRSSCVPETCAHGMFVHALFVRPLAPKHNMIVVCLMIFGSVFFAPTTIFFSPREVRSNFRCVGRGSRHRNRLNEIELSVCVFICHSFDKIIYNCLVAHCCCCYCWFSLLITFTIRTHGAQYTRYASKSCLSRLLELHSFIRSKIDILFPSSFALLRFFARSFACFKHFFSLSTRERECECIAFNVHGCLLFRSLSVLTRFFYQPFVSVLCRFLFDFVFKIICEFICICLVWRTCAWGEVYLFPLNVYYSLLTEKPNRENDNRQKPKTKSKYIY